MVGVLLISNMGFSQKIDSLGMEFSSESILSDFIFLKFYPSRKFDLRNIEDIAIIQKQISIINKSFESQNHPIPYNICDNLSPLKITADYNGKSSSVDVTLRVKEGWQEEIYFFGEHPDDFEGAQKMNSVQIKTSGTYYFRSLKVIANDNSNQIQECWSDWTRYKVFQTNAEIEVDAGNDQTICLGDEVQLNANIVNANQGELLYEANKYSHFQEWITSYTTNSNPWNLNSPTNLAGGTLPEIRYNWVAGVNENISNWISYGPIDASNSQNVELSFKHFSDHFSSNYNYQLKVETSLDGTNWTPTTFNISPISNVGPQNITIDLSSLDGTQFYIRFGITGNEFGLYYWYIDDIKVIGSDIATAIYSWSANVGSDPDPNNILNPNVSPTETTIYTLTVNYGDVEISDQVTITVHECLEDYEVCANEVLNLNETLPLNVDPSQVTWCEDVNGQPDSSSVVNPENVLPGIYWAYYDDSFKTVTVRFLFTEDCLNCIEEVYSEYIEQTGPSEDFSPTESDFLVFDFYYIEKGIKIRFSNGAQLFPFSNFMYFNNSPNPNVRFIENGIWGVGEIPMISELTGEPGKPILRIVFGVNGVEGFYGSRVSSTDTDYTLEPVEFFNSESFNPNFIWYNDNINPIRIQKAGSLLKYNLRSINLTDCPDPPNEVFINPQIKQRTDHE